MRSKSVLAFALVFILGLMAFKCGSPELETAKLEMKNKRWDTAKEALVRAIAKNPADEEAHYRMGIVNKELKDYDGMLESFDKAMAVGKKFQKEINFEKENLYVDAYNRGGQYFNGGMNAGDDKAKKEKEFRGAIDNYNICTKIAPDSANPYLMIAYSMYLLEDKANLSEPLEKAVKLSKPGQGEDAYKLYSSIQFEKYYQLAEKDSASAKKFANKLVTEFEEAKEKNPESELILGYLANSYLYAQRIEDAKVTFKGSIEKDPSSFINRYSYGVLLLNANEFQEAASQFGEVIQLKPEYSNAYYNLAATYIKWGNKEIDIVEAKDPNAVSEKGKELFAKAIEPLNKYAELEPEKAEPWQLLLRIYAYLGMKDQEAEAMKKFEELSK